MMNSKTSMEILKLNTDIQINCKIKQIKKGLNISMCKTSQYKITKQILKLLVFFF